MSPNDWRALSAHNARMHPGRRPFGPESKRQRRRPLWQVVAILTMYAVSGVIGGAVVAAAIRYALAGWPL